LSKHSHEFSWVEGLVFCLAYIGIQLSSETFNQWGTYFYSPSEGVGRTIYVSIGLVGVIFFIATLWDAITDPLIGIWSDRTDSRPGRWRLPRMTGRRRPFIFWGSILMTFTFIGIWYPPVEGTSWINFAFGAVMMCLHWLFFTITTVPILALGPEIARSEQARVRLGIWIAVGFIVGLALANALSGILLTAFDTAPEGAPTSAVGYRRVAVIYAVVSLILFQLLAWTVKERHVTTEKETSHTPIMEGLGDAAKNLPFVIYFIAFFCFTTGFLAVARVLPYWAELGLAGNEETVSKLLTPFIFTALLSYLFIPAVAKRLGVKWTMFLSLLNITLGLPAMYFIARADVPMETRFYMGAALFAWCGIGQGILYVMITPLMGEIIDYDERKSGQRREALYNGLSGVAWKASMGGSIIIATVSMKFWGNSNEDPLGVYLVGPIAGIFGLIGCIAMAFYPRIHVTPKEETEALASAAIPSPPSDSPAGRQ
jgi:GPH family glycoside/pentoside/hexuronide:cation symporter